MKSNKTKILCAYHKKTKLFKSPILFPFLGGAEFLSKKDKNFKWFKKNLLFDNVGENISKLNKSLNEMSIVYWAYKNYDKLNNPDYIGLNHYRRLFNFSGNKLNRFNVVRSLGMDDSSKIEEIFKTYDIIACKLAFEDKDSAVKRVSGLIEAVNLKEKHPGMYRSFERFCETGAFYCGNIAIYKRDDFFKYCDIIFDIILPIQKKWTEENHPEANTRFLGCVCELLTGFYIDYLEKECNYKVKNQEICNLSDIAESKANISFSDIFSVKNEYRDEIKRKVVTILGLKFKFKLKQKKRKTDSFKIINKGFNNKIFLTLQNGEKRPLIDYAPIPIEIIWDNNLCEIPDKTVWLNNAIIIHSDNSSFVMKPSYNQICSFEAHIVHGNNQKIFIDENFSMGGGYLYALEENSSVTIGKDCMFSTDICIMTGDAHVIKDMTTKKVINFNNDGVRIGNHVWLGKYSKVIKNVSIADGTIVGLNSLVTKKFDEKNVILAGNPAKIVKTNVEWERTPVSHYKKQELLKQNSKKRERKRGG